MSDALYLAGDLSGIQRFVLRVKTAGKAQAKRLRARSFLLELVERGALWHVEQRLRVSEPDILIRGGGGFLVRLAKDADRAQLEQLNADLQRMLWDEFGGEIQFALGWAPTPADARADLERRKRQPSRAVLQSAGFWDAERLARPPLADPCEVCGEFPGFRDVHEDDEERIVRHCRSCLKARQIGADLTRRQWLRAGRGPIRALEVAFELVEEWQEGAWRVGRWIPRAKGGRMPLTFQDLARHSRGDSRLAVLKADVDDMGVRVGEIGASDPSCRRLHSFSRTLHGFFAEQMQDAAARRWPLIYTLYAGGDDLLLVAPWQVMLDFAGELVQQFQIGPAKQYGPLTLCAGIALSPYRVPIRHAVQRAETLLDLAKRQRGKKGKMRAELEKQLGKAGGRNGAPCGCAESTCAVCRVFGAHSPRSTLGPSRIIVRDGRLRSGGQIENKTENVINRQSGAAQHPRSNERVVEGTEFDLQIVLQVFDLDRDFPYDDRRSGASHQGDAALQAVVAKGLRLVQLTGLGGGTSRGSGAITFRDFELDGAPWVHWSD